MVEASRGGSAVSALSRQDSRIDELLFSALLIALAWVPFWFGSNTALAWAINAMVFCGLVVAYEIGLMATGRSHAVSLKRVWPAVAAVVAVVLWCLLQIATWIPIQYQHPVWQLARETLGLQISGSVSINRDLTLLALLRLITAVSAFWLALQLTRSATRARRLIQALAVIGLIYAVYGLIAFFAFPKTILWFEKQYYLDSLTSTFVNRNSYATYAAMALVCATTLVLNAFQDRMGGDSVQRRLASAVAAVTGRAGAWLAVALVIAMAMMLTASRGGISAGLLGLVSLAALTALQRRKSKRFVLGGMLAVVAFVAVASTFGDLLATRLSIQGFESDDRLATYALTWTSILDRPIFGFGYGTFEDAFPMYRDASVGPYGVWDKAHNTYLEVLQGLGLPVGVLFLLGVGALVWRCGMGVLTRRRSTTAPLAASAASVVVLSHAVADFSLQIQAVTLTWMALLGAGVAQSWSQTIDTRT